MPEYIEREAVYDVFTAKQQELLKFYRYYQLNDEAKEEFDRYDRYLNEIEAIPTADVVEVVRCKDCKWWENKDRCRNVNGLNHLVWNGDWFCASGQRKEGAEE